MNSPDSLTPRVEHGRAHDAGLLLIRLMLATVFVYHGSQKVFGAFGGHGISGFAGWLGSLGVPLPTLNAWAAGLTELLGGIALGTGVLLRPAAIPLAFTMLVAATVAHSGFDVTQGGGEYPLTLAAVVVGLALTGPGRYTLQTLVCSVLRKGAAVPTPTTSA